MFTIRRVLINDAVLLQQLSAKTFEETFAVHNTAENMQRYIAENFSTARLSDEINNPGSEFYFAVFDDSIIGYIKINFRDAQTEIKSAEGIEIERIYVLKAYQGQNAGALLFNTALQIAKSKKAKYVWLGVWEKNEKAIGFYLKNGLRVFDKHIFVLGDDAQTDLMMKLDLLQ
jgi:Acetyltransferases